MNQPIPANQATSETAPQTATEAPPDCDCTATQAEANQPRIQSTIAPQFDSNTLQSTGIAPQGMGIHGDFIANAPTEFIYVAGQLRPHFPNQGLKQEYDYAAQLLGKSPYDYYDIFSDPDYRYIAEQVSWILSIDSQDVYVLLPDSSDELNEFIATLKMEENLTDETQTVAIGILGPVAPADLTPKDQPLKMVLCKHLYHFTYAELLKELTGNNTTTTSIRDVLEALSKKPNIGLAPQDRAKNFVAFRYSSIYCKTSGLDPNDTTEPDESQFLAKLETKLSAGAPGRVVVDIIFTYQKTVSGRQSAYYVGVDVTDQFPFIHSALTDYIPS